MLNGRKDTIFHIGPQTGRKLSMDELCTEMSKITENGVEINVQANHDKPAKAKTFYNPIMTICREFALAAVAAAVDKTETLWKCLDAFGATGIAGLQWKHHLKEKVDVTINEISQESFSQIQQNCTTNGFNHIVRSAESSPRSAGCAESSPASPSSGEESPRASVTLVNSDANVVMHQKQFHFIHLDPYGTTVQFLDAAFRNCYNKGIIVITSTDVASLYGKCPQVTLRNYDAFTVKTDYTKEIAARLVLAAACRTAARCNKGIEVLYSVAVEHFVQVAIRICRGPTNADGCMPLIRRTLHCQICEDWACYPDTRTPTEQPYDLLPCTCHKEIPGKTAVELGPMWCGELFSVTFLHVMQQCCRKLKLSERIQSLLDTMLVEAECARSSKPREPSVFPHQVAPPAQSGTDEGHCKDELKNSNKESDQETGTESSSRPANCKTAAKRKLSDNSEDPTSRKRTRTVRNITDDQMPLFFYNVHRRKVKGVDLPKANKLVGLLHREGYRASRTHFDPMGIRTDASLEQLKAVLVKHCSNQ